MNGGMVFPPLLSPHDIVMYRIDWGSGGVSVLAHTARAALELVSRYENTGYINVVVRRRSDGRTLSVEDLRRLAARRSAPGGREPEEAI